MLVFLILLLKQNLSDFQIQFVSIFSWNALHIIKNLFHWVLFDGAFFLSVFNLQVKCINLKFAHIFSKWFFQYSKSFLSLSKVV